MIDNFSKLCLDNGGDIIPLIIPPDLTNGTGITNPSILIDGDKVLLNIRHVGYSLYLCENQQKFQTKWGPFVKFTFILLRLEAGNTIMFLTMNLRLNRLLTLILLKKLKMNHLTN